MYRVVIADDEPKVSRLIRSLIQWEALGLELVGVADDGVTALEMIGTLLPDIVITDIRMPGYDGIQLIERAKQLKPEIDFIIISGYRQFEYAQKAIRFGVEDYLVKPLKAGEINGTLRKMIDRYLERDRRQLEQVQEAVRQERNTRAMREQFLEALLEGPDEGGRLRCTEPPYGDLARAFTQQAGNGILQALYIKTDYPPEAMGSNGRRLLSDKVAALTQEMLMPVCEEVLITRRGSGAAGLALYVPEKERALRKALQGIIDSLQCQREVFPELRVTIGLGPVVSGMSDAGHSFSAAEAAAADRLLVGAGCIIEAAAAEPSLPEELKMPQEVRRSLQNGLEVLDVQAVTAAVQTMEARAAAAPSLRGAHLLAVAEELMETVRYGLGVHFEADPALKALEGDCREAVSLCYRQKELFGLVKAYAAKSVTHLSEQKLQETKRPIREARRYIQVNFGGPLNLEAVSQAVGFNPTYFSELFKKETGMNFLEYLTDVRVREAKRLLADPVKTIADIAEAVGYSDVKHFSKTFSRITGIQPSQYRKLYY